MTDAPAHRRGIPYDLVPRERRALRWSLAILILGGSMLPTIAATLLSVVFQLPELPPDGGKLLVGTDGIRARFDDLAIVIVFSYAPVAALLVLRDPRLVVLPLALDAIGSGFAYFGDQYALLSARLSDSGGEPLAFDGFFAHLGGWAFLPGAVLVHAIPLLLLPGAGGGGRKPFFVLLAAAAAAITLAGATRQAPMLPPNPLAIADPGYQAALPLVFGFAATTGMLLAVYSIGVILHRLTGTRRGSRYLLGWLLVGQLLILLLDLMLTLPPLGLPSSFWAFASILPVIGQLFFPAAALVMGLQHRLRSVDLAVSRLLATTIVAVVAVSAYLVVIELLGGTRHVDAFQGFAAVAAITVLVHPLRLAARCQVDRLVYGGRPSPEHFVATLGRQVNDFATGTEGVQSLLVALRTSLELGSVRLEGAGELGVEPVGTPSGEELRVPLPSIAKGADSSTAVAIVATGEASGPPLGMRTRGLLDDLAPILGAVVLLARASVSLDATRAQLASSLHGERRALRRELHDGLGPALSGAGFAVAGAVNQLARGERETARETISVVDSLLAERIESLAVFSQPAVPKQTASLASSELGAALDRLVASFRAAGPELGLTLGDVRGLSARTAGSLYRIASEALLNAVRHAGAGRIDIELSVDAPEVLVVSDDGCGLGAPGETGRGVGLASMNEWAREIGGHLIIEASAAGGTRIAVRLTDRGAN